MSNAFLLDDATTDIENLDLDLQVSFDAQMADVNGFDMLGSRTSPNRTYNHQSMCPTCC
ncbi:hypothetical protein [Sphaerisporangium fuscum]|uniref:hypothetical protein n=1 Tax=Sphaerisporangium fuscum TaxID=2835868 RepID=UPI001BDBF970|nr:hypothetical protein [Sphaerisporangium fuscum]